MGLRGRRSDGSTPAREFEPSGQTIRDWVAQADRDEDRRADGLTTAEREELGRLRRDNRRLREEREILAKPPPGSDYGPDRFWSIDRLERIPSHDFR